MSYSTMNKIQMTLFFAIFVFGIVTSVFWKPSSQTDLGVLMAGFAVQVILNVLFQREIVRYQRKLQLVRARITPTRR